MKHEIQDRPILSVRHLSVSYTAAPVLQEVCLDINPHQIVAIVGPNGSGKTTILKTIGGLIKPCRGRVYFDGEPIDQLSVG